MSNVMSLKQFDNKVKRNGFDLSFKNAFTAKAGELLPIMCKEVLPGDRFVINAQSFTRTQPLDSAAYVRMREYYDVVFVPYRLLWSNYPQFFTNLPDYHRASSINANSIAGDQHPYFTYNDINTLLTSIEGNATYKNNFMGFDRASLSKKLLEYLGYGDVGYATAYSVENTALSPNFLLAYQKAYSDFFRDDQWETAAPYTYNMDYINNTSSLHLPVSSIDPSNMTMFDLRYVSWPKDYLMGMLPSPQYGEESYAPINMARTGNGLFTVGEFTLTQGPASIIDGNAAYQSGDALLIGSSHSLDADGLQGSSSHINTSHSNNNAGAIATGVRFFSGNGDGLSILALRQAEALQKWKEIAQSGRYDYQTQMQKHWNVSPDKSMSGHAYYVDGWTTNMDINAVTNTNLSAGTSKPDLYGNGTASSNGKNIVFDTQRYGNEHGVLMVLYHVMPLLDYSVDGVDKSLLKTHFTDYAIPEFDSVGMQDVNPIEMDFSLMDTSTESGQNPTVLGYVPRYAEYKTSLDRVHGAFVSTLKNWVSPIDRNYFRGYFTDETSLDYTFFKVRPDILNNIFGVEVDSTVDTDQFLINCFFDVKAVRNLDYNGLPY